MTNAIDREQLGIRSKKEFQEFIFIGNISNKSVSKVTEQLKLSPNSECVSQAAIEDSLKIVKLHTDKNITHQLKDLKIEPGAVVRLVNKTNSGSVVVSLGNKLIGIGAEIAGKIVATPAT